MRLFIALILCLGFSGAGVRFASAGDDGYLHSARVDLDGDGKRERISLTRVRLNSLTKPDRYRLTINGRRAEAPVPGFIHGFRIKKIRRTSAQRQVVVTLGNDATDWRDSDVYSYAGGRVRRLNKHPLISVEIAGDGTVRHMSSWNGFWAAERTYLLDRSGKLNKVKKLWHPVNVRATVGKSLTLYTKPKSDRVKLVLPRGKGVRLEVGEVSGDWYRVRSSGGSRGWMRGEDANPCLGIPMAG